MGKTIKIPAQLGFTQFNNNCDIGTLVDKGNGYADATNISMSVVKNVLGSGFWGLSQLAKTNLVNVWSPYSPVGLGYNTSESFTRVNPTSEYKLGDFAGYNHQATAPKGNTGSTTISSTTLSGFIQISGSMNLGELDWETRNIGGQVMNYVWLKADNEGTITWQKAHVNTQYSGQVSVQVDVAYSFPQKGEDVINCTLMFGNSGQALAKAPISPTFSVTIKDVL